MVVSRPMRLLDASSAFVAVTVGGLFAYIEISEQTNDFLQYRLVFLGNDGSADRYRHRKNSLSCYSHLANLASRIASTLLMD